MTAETLDVYRHDRKRVSTASAGAAVAIEPAVNNVAVLHAQEARWVAWERGSHNSTA